MKSPSQLAISPDGRNVYGADSARKVASKIDVLDRRPCRWRA